MFESDTAHPREGRIRNSNPVGGVGIPTQRSQYGPRTTPQVSSAVIRIVNPPDQLRATVSLKHCHRWLKAGLAVWVVPNMLLRILPQLRRRLMGADAIAKDATGGEYDSIRRQMRSEERRHIPIAQPPPRPTRRKIVVAHSGPAGRVQTFTEAELAERDKRQKVRYTPLPPVIGSFRG